MYQQHFHLNDRPFASAPNPEHYFPASSIEQAREVVSLNIERSSGVSLVTGGVGSGKTLFCQLLANQFSSSLPVCMISGGRLRSREALLQTLLHGLGLPYRGETEGEMRLTLTDHISGQSCINGILLIIDEADRLPLAPLDEVRVLSNLVRDGQPRVRLVLAGAHRLEERVGHPKLESLNQRVVGRLYLEDFTNEETSDYIRARINACGGDSSAIFADDAWDVVFRATNGVPRLVNQVCDHAMLMAAVSRADQLTGMSVEEAWADLQQLPMPTTSEIDVNDDEQTVVEFGSLEEDDAGRDERPQDTVGGIAVSTDGTLVAFENDFEPALAGDASEIPASDMEASLGESFEAETRESDLVEGETSESTGMETDDAELPKDDFEVQVEGQPFELHIYESEVLAGETEVVVAFDTEEDFADSQTRSFGDGHLTTVTMEPVEQPSSDTENIFANDNAKVEFAHQTLAAGTDESQPVDVEPVEAEVEESPEPDTVSGETGVDQPGDEDASVDVVHSATDESEFLSAEALTHDGQGYQFESTTSGSMAAADYDATDAESYQAESYQAGPTLADEDEYRIAPIDSWEQRNSPFADEPDVFAEAEVSSGHEVEEEVTSAVGTDEAEGTDFVAEGIEDDTVVTSVDVVTDDFTEELNSYEPHDANNESTATELPLELTMDQASNPFGDDFEEEEIVIQQFSSPSQIARGDYENVTSAYSRHLSAQLSAAHPGLRMHQEETVEEFDSAGGVAIAERESDSPQPSAGFQPLSAYYDDENEPQLTDEQTTDDGETLESRPETSGAENLYEASVETDDSADYPSSEYCSSPEDGLASEEAATADQLVDAVTDIASSVREEVALGEGARIDDRAEKPKRKKRFRSLFSGMRRTK